jgi:hypothetical protein
MSFDIDGRERPNQGIVLSRKRTRQPQGVVEVDQAAISRLGVVGGVVVTGAWPPSNLLSGTALSYASSELRPVVTPDGIAASRYDAVAGPSRSVGFNSGSFNTQNFTLLARIKATDLYNTNSAILASTTSGNLSFWGNTQWDMRVGGSNYSASGSFSKDVWYDVAIVGTATSCTLYIDGVSVIAEGAAISVTTNEDLLIVDSGSSDDLHFAYFAVCDKPLSLGEINAFQRNPWQLFAPIKSNHALSLTPKRQVWTPRQTRLLGTSSGSVATVAIQTSKSIVRTKQPQGAVGLASWLPIQAELCVLLSNPVLDIASEQLGSVSAPSSLSIGVNSQGKYASFASTAHISFSGRDAELHQDVTIAAVVVWDGGSGNQSVLSDNGSGAAGWRLTIAGSTGVCQLIADGTGSFNGVALTSGDPYFVIASHTKDTGETYIYARNLRTGVVSSNSQTDAATASYATNGVITIGVARGSVTVFTSQVNFAFLSWNFLPQVSALDWLLNPWKLFAPRKQTIWTPAP